MSDPHPPAPSGGGGGKKMNPGMLVGMAIAALIAAFIFVMICQMMFGAKTEIIWTWDFFMKATIVAVIIGGLAKAIFSK